jgi:hypothetical protein
LDNFTGFDFQFTVGVGCELGTRWSSPDTFVGQQKIGQFVVYDDESGLQEYASKISLEEYRNDENLILLKQVQQAKGYYYSNDEFVLKQNAKQVSHIHDCNRCGGSGEIDCPRCGGSKRVNCQSCHGSGTRNCSYCHGSPVIYKTVHSRSEMTGAATTQQVFDHHCYYCHGSGNEDCPTCGGEKTVWCNACSDDGQVTCDVCNGMRKVTDVFTLSVCATPRHLLSISEDDTDKDVVQALNKVKSVLDSYTTELIRTSLEAYPEKRYVIDAYRATVPFAKFTTTYERKEYNWVLFGKEPERLDSGNILDTILQPDLEVLKGATSIKSFFLSEAKRIKNFMKSEANQDLFDCDAKNCQGKNNQNLDVRAERVREQIGRSFTPEYIKDSIAAMEKRVRSICFRSHFKWFVLLYILSIIVGLVWVGILGARGTYLDHAKSDAIVIGVTFLTFFIGSFFARSSRTKYLKKIGTSHLSKWANATKLNKSKWFVYPVFGSLSVAVPICTLRILAANDYWLDYWLFLLT